MMPLGYAIGVPNCESAQLLSRNGSVLRQAEPMHSQ